MSTPKTPPISATKRIDKAGRIYVASHIPKSVYRDLNRLCGEQDRTLSYMVASFIAAGIERAKEAK